MPKQASLHKINGKADGRSYYYSQNGGWLSRTINPGMSERVKTAPEFANTRRNGKEFGSIGMFCGSIVRSLTNRWRFILDPITTGKFVKDVYNLLRAETGVWGQRQLSENANHQVYKFLNKYSKNPLPNGLAAEFNDNTMAFLTTNTATVAVNNEDGIELGNNWAEEIQSKGATHAVVLLVAMRSTPPIYSETAESYAEGTPGEMLIMAEEDITLGSSQTIFASSYTPFVSTSWEEDVDAHAVGIIVLPQKMIGSNLYTMQELCSFHCVSVERSYTRE